MAAAKKKVSKGSAPKMTQAQQSQKFLEAAREVGVDESGKAFERALSVVTGPKKNTSADA